MNITTPRKPADMLDALIASINQKKAKGMPFYIQLSNLENLACDDTIDSFCRAQVLVAVAKDYAFYKDNESAIRASSKASEYAERILSTELLHPADRQYMLRLFFISKLMCIENNNVSAFVDLIASKNPLLCVAVKASQKEVMRYCLDKERVSKWGPNILIYALEAVRTPDDIKEITHEFLKHNYTFTNNLSETIDKLTTTAPNHLSPYFIALKFVYSDCQTLPFNFLGSPIDVLNFLFTTLLKLDYYTKISISIQLMKNRKNSLIEAIKYFVAPTGKYSVEVTSSDVVDNSDVLQILGNFVGDLLSYYYEVEKYERIVALVDKLRICFSSKPYFANIIFAAYTRTKRIVEAADIMSLSFDDINTELIAEYLIIKGNISQALDILDKEKNLYTALKILEAAQRINATKFLFLAVKHYVSKHAKLNAILSIAIIHYATGLLDASCCAKVKECIHQYILSQILSIYKNEECFFLYKNFLIKKLMLCTACPDIPPTLILQANDIVVANFFDYLKLCFHENDAEGIKMLSNFIFRGDVFVKSNEIQKVLGFIRSADGIKKEEVYWEMLSLVYQVSSIQFMYEELSEVIEYLCCPKESIKEQKIAILECLCKIFKSELLEKATEKKLITEKAVKETLKASIRRGDLKKVIQKIERAGWLKRKRIQDFLKGQIGDHEL